MENKYERFKLVNVFVNLTKDSPNIKLKSCNEINNLTQELEEIDIDSLDDNNLEQLEKVISSRFNIDYEKYYNDENYCNKEKFIQSSINYYISYTLASTQIYITNNFRIDKFMKKDVNRNSNTYGGPKNKEEVLDNILSKLSNFKIDDYTQLIKYVFSNYRGSHIEDNYKIDLNVLNHFRKTLNHKDPSDYINYITDSYLQKYNKAKELVLNNINLTEKRIKNDYNFFKDLEEKRKRHEEQQEEQRKEKIKNITRDITKESIISLKIDEIKKLDCDGIDNKRNFLSNFLKPEYKKEIRDYLIEGGLINLLFKSLISVMDCDTKEISEKKFVGLLNYYPKYFAKCNYKYYKFNLDEFKEICKKVHTSIFDLASKSGGSHRKKSRSRTRNRSRSKKSKSKSKRTKSKSKK